jgi:hypothetical protein
MSIWTGIQKREAASLNRRAPTGYRRYFPRVRSARERTGVNRIP